jgi:glycerol-3-phosphate dehydrogenase
MPKSLAENAGKSFDVFIIGGGINGAVAAQHLTAAGYSVMLAEKDDFASAATSRSSRVLHNGLRYLQPKKSVWEFLTNPTRFRGQVRTAREAIGAMGQIVKNSPSRVRPVSLTIPVYKSAPYSGWMVDLGVKFLGLFNSYRIDIGYRRFKGGDLTAHPTLKWYRETENVKDYVVFQDYSLHWPERVTVDAAMEAQRMGAVVRNYATVTGMSRQSDGKWKIDVIGSRDGQDRCAVTATCVLNTAGVWIDDINTRVAGTAQAGRKIIAVKGIHILAKLPAQLRGYGIGGFHRHNEPLFALPWGDLHLIGPTETIYEGSLDDVRPEEDDIKFLIDEMNWMFPEIGLKRSDIQFTYAGARPITYDVSYPKGRRLPFSVLHDQAQDGMPNVFSLTWGTIMLHRVSADMLLDAVRKKIAPSREPRPIDFDPQPFPQNQNSPSLLEGDAAVKLSDLRYSAEHEQVGSLVDLLFRRTYIGWLSTIKRSDVEKAANEVAPILGWDDQRVRKEVDDFAAYTKRYHLQELG